MERIFVLGTRGSPLAVAQARSVAGAIEAAHGWASGTVVIRTIRTSGDRIQDRPLAEVGGKALWTKELDLALLDGTSDLSVHSMKDVESERPMPWDSAILRSADAATADRGAVDRRLARERVVATSSTRARSCASASRPSYRPIRGTPDPLDKTRGAGDATMPPPGLDRWDRGGMPSGRAMLPGREAAIGVECGRR